MPTLSTANVAGTAWRDYGEIVVCDDEAAMIAYSDFIAAEHLQVHTADPQATAKKLRNYGSLFIGAAGERGLFRQVLRHQPHAADHGRGPLHRRALGRLLRQDLHPSVARRAGVEAVAPPAIRQSASEGLEGHRRAAALRMERMQLG